MTVALVLVAAVALAAVSYAGLARMGRAALLPAGLRALAWASLGLLLLNPGCPVAPAARRPVVLLDGSLSMTAAGGRWAEALAAARDSGEVRLFGDPDAPLDSVPGAGTSRLAAALAGARASGRRVLVMSDGEIGDSLEAAASLRGAGVMLFPRAAGDAAVAIASVLGPARATERDTVVLHVALRARGLAAPATTAIEVRTGGRVVHVAPARLADGLTVVDLALPPRILPEGDHVLVLALRDSLDVERRDDQRLHLLTVTRTPGVVVAASPGDWDARFLFRTLRDVADLPVEGYVELVGGQWRRMSDLSPVDAAVVRQAIAHADLAVLRGTPGPGVAQPTGAVLAWPSPATPDEALEGDWYLQPGEGPVASALAGFPIDSFAPSPALLPLTPSEGDWVGLSGQAGRRGTARPALVGSTRGGPRRVTIGAQGLWRWAFRGGSSEQAYRAMVASAVDWLLGGADSARGAARPIQPVVANGRPLVYAWAGNGPPEPVGIRLRAAGDSSGRVDTLAFDGAGRAMLYLPPGVYTYALDAGGRGVVAVEEYSEEWFPRPVALSAAVAAADQSPRRQGVRERWWLFALAVLAFSAEWVVRRRMGLR